MKRNFRKKYGENFFFCCDFFSENFFAVEIKKQGTSEEMIQKRKHSEKKGRKKTDKLSRTFTESLYAKILLTGY